MAKRPLPPKQNARRKWAGGRPTRSDATDGPLSLYGIHTVAAALANPARTRHRLLTTPNALARLTSELAALIGAESAHATLANLLTETVTAAALSRRLGGDAVHQGCLLEVEPLASEAALDVARIQRVLVLDQITDPHNVGAILRSAAAFAVDAVVTTARHSPVETGVLAKSASGALDHVPLVRVRNLAVALEDMSAAGITLVGFDSDAPVTFEELELAEPYAIVLGAEGKGLREKTRGLCTHLVRLAMPGTIRSLNVSNAAAIALYAARRNSTEVR